MMEEERWPWGGGKEGQEKGEGSNVIVILDEGIMGNMEVSLKYRTGE